MLRPFTIAALVLAAAASLGHMPGEAKPRAGATTQPVLSAGARRGLAFAEQRCSSCHAVSPNRTSPNPESPPFEDIANRPGVTPTTLREFLRNSHNFPAAMNFTVEPRQIGDLADYIRTMKKRDYRPIM